MASQFGETCGPGCGGVGRPAPNSGGDAAGSGDPRRTVEALPDAVDSGRPAVQGAAGSRDPRRTVGGCGGVARPAPNGGGVAGCGGFGETCGPGCGGVGRPAPNSGGMRRGRETRAERGRKQARAVWRQQVTAHGVCLLHQSRHCHGDRGKGGPTIPSVFASGAFGSMIKSRFRTVTGLIFSSRVRFSSFDFVAHSRCRSLSRFRS